MSDPEPRIVPCATPKQLDFIAKLLERLVLPPEEQARVISSVAEGDSLESLTVATASDLIDQLHIEAKERGISLAQQITDKQILFVKKLKRKAHLTQEEFKKILLDTTQSSSIEAVPRKLAPNLISTLIDLAQENRT